MPGYQCTYERNVTLTLSLQTTRTMAELSADTVVIETLKRGVAAALGLTGNSAAVLTFGGFRAVAVVA